MRRKWYGETRRNCTARVLPGGDIRLTRARAAAVAAGSAALQSDVGAGSQIGDRMTMPPSPLDPGVGSLGSGQTDPGGAFYDPAARRCAGDIRQHRQRADLSGGTVAAAHKDAETRERAQ